MTAWQHDLVNCFQQGEALSERTVRDAWEASTVAVAVCLQCGADTRTGTVMTDLRSDSRTEALALYSVYGHVAYVYCDLYCRQVIVATGKYIGLVVK